MWKCAIGRSKGEERKGKIRRVKVKVKIDASRQEAQFCRTSGRSEQRLSAHIKKRECEWTRCDEKRYTAVEPE